MGDSRPSFSAEEDLEFSSRVVLLRPSPLGPVVVESQGSIEGASSRGEIPRHSGRARIMSEKGREAALVKDKADVDKDRNRAFSGLKEGVEISKNAGMSPSFHQRDRVCIVVQNARHREGQV